MGCSGNGEAMPDTVNTLPQFRHLTLYILLFIAMVTRLGLSIAQKGVKIRGV
jgi:hypothetical protein